MEENIKKYFEGYLLPLFEEVLKSEFSNNKENSDFVKNIREYTLFFFSYYIYKSQNSSERAKVFAYVDKLLDDYLG